MTSPKSPDYKRHRAGEHEDMDGVENGHPRRESDPSRYRDDRNQEDRPEGPSLAEMAAAPIGGAPSSDPPQRGCKVKLGVDQRLSGT